MLRRVIRGTTWRAVPTLVVGFRVPRFSVAYLPRTSTSSNVTLDHPSSTLGRPMGLTTMSALEFKRFYVVRLQILRRRPCEGPWMRSDMKPTLKEQYNVQLPPFLPEPSSLMETMLVSRLVSSASEHFPDLLEESHLLLCCGEQYAYRIFDALPTPLHVIVLPDYPMSLFGRRSIDLGCLPLEVSSPLHDLDVMFIFGLKTCL
ncbi:hypothetical protein SISSUDRAFT_298182 [Sistotremastrum suecicum HHB10207 ss-3]|uniref:Uncharacterized protein n=1 Tax=Sistotremastrum suecicum HHB10207 ss-3 TaxID=1314776 RepID=A0A165ZFN9_9AGAM|nr:hypothetical protein SISSUDRAFT_298182 [Sistotremastrum suecicum HHB10207 ss-3]